MACLTGSTAAWPLSSSFFLTRAFKRPRQRAKALSSPNHPVDTFRASGTGDIPLAEQSSAPAPKSAIAMSGEFANSANLFPTRIILNEWCTRQDSNLWPLDRKSVVEGKSVSVRVELGGRRIIKKK